MVSMSNFAVVAVAALTVTMFFFERWAGKNHY